MSYIKKNRNQLSILCFIMLFQEIVYFGTKLLQPYQIVLNNPIDDKIPFIPQFAHFYYIWYLLLIFVPLIILKYDKKSFYNYTITCFIFIVVEFFCFVAFPTTLIRTTFEVNSFSTWVVDVIYKSDTPVYNLFPSGHCAYSLLFITSILDMKKINYKIKLPVVIVSIFIMLSTLFIKQHVIIDVIGAFIIIPIYYFVKKKNIEVEGNRLYAKIFHTKQSK